MNRIIKNVTRWFDTAFLLVLFPMCHLTDEPS
jgi:hypothetical protein